MFSRKHIQAVIIIIISLFGSLLAYAQDEPVVASLRAVEPVSTNIGDQFSVEVVVNSTVPVYSGDVTLSFNPDNLQVVGEPTQGSFFAAGGPQFITEPDNIAGSVQYGYSQQGRVEQVTGEGVFVTFQFEVVSAGSIRIGIREAKFTTIEVNEDGVPTGSISQPVRTEDLILDGGDPPQVIEESTITQPVVTNTAQPTSEVTVTEVTAVAEAGVTGVADTPTESPEPTWTLIPEPPESEDVTGGLPIIPILTVVIVAAFVLLIGYMGFTAVKSRKPAHAQLTHYNQNDSYSGNKHIKMVENRSYIGREKGRQVNVVIKDGAVSAVHALIIRRNLKEYFIADIKSTNGTYIYNPLADTYEKIPVGQAYQLVPGTIIRFGKTLHFTFEPLPKEAIGQTVRQDTVGSFENRLVSTDTIVQD